MAESNLRISPLYFHDPLFSDCSRGTPSCKVWVDGFGLLNASLARNDKAMLRKKQHELLQQLRIEPTYLSQVIRLLFVKINNILQSRSEASAIKKMPQQTVMAELIKESASRLFKKWFVKGVLTAVMVKQIIRKSRIVIA